MSEQTTLPYSPTAEEAVLGAILIDPETIQKVGKLDPMDFYIERNRWVYLAALELYRSGQAVDYLTVCAALDKAGRLSSIGGPARVTQLINSTVSALHAESYAEIVAEKARRRRLIDIASRLASSAFDEKSNLSDAISTALDALSRTVVSAKGAAHISQYLSALYDEVEAAHANPREVYGIPTGLADWDRITYGLHPGEVVRLGGEPGLGKSLLLFQILTNVARAGHPVALYEIEMSARQVVRRGVSAASRIATSAMRSGKISASEWSQFCRAIEEMEKLPIHISDDSSLTTADLRADLQRLVEYHGVEVVGIDYEALLQDSAGNEYERRNLISDRVHAIAKDLNLAIISIGDMTKSAILGETKGQGAMAGTAHELHNADQIVIMRKSDRPNVVTLTWEKLREGEGNRIMELVKLPGLPAFGDAAPVERQAAPNGNRPSTARRVPAPVEDTPF